MYGITNAKTVISGGSGGGDTVYAVSETALNKDDKVYLNKYYLNSYEYSRYTKGSGGKMVEKVAYCFNNGDLVISAGGDIYWAQYNAEKKEQTYYSVAGNSYTSYFDSIYFLDGYLVRKATGSAHKDAFLFKTKTVVMDGSILRKDLLFTQVSASQFKLTKINNPETGELGEVYSTITVPNSGYFCGVKIEGNTLFYTNSNGYYAFYDITDLTAPVLLNSGSTEINTVYIVTGLTAGNYVFGTVNETRDSNTTDVCIYKIDEGLNLVSANDLPDYFYSAIGKNNGNVSVTYNVENNVLAFGEWDRFLLYKWDGKKFTRLGYDMPIPTDYTQSTNYCKILYVSQDLTNTVQIGRIYSSTQTVNYYPENYYVFPNEQDDSWHAEGFSHITSLSLHGFATGNTNDKGEYEVSTVLPKVLNVTINTNVDTELELYGSAE